LAADKNADKREGGPSSYLERMNRFLLYCSCLVLLLTMSMAVLNMVLRPMGRPLSGSFELLGFGSALIAALGLGYSQDEKSHISVDLLFRHLSPGLQRLLEGTGLAACALFFAMAFYRIMGLAHTMYSTGEVSETLRIPYYPVVAVVAVGFLALSVTLIKDAFYAFSGRRSRG